MSRPNAVGTGQSLWQVVTASVRGASHRRSDLPNQDAVRDVATGAGTIVAVADGHGSSRSFRSDIGARLAVTAATEALSDLAVLDRGIDEVMDRIVSSGPLAVVDRWASSVRADLDTHPFAPSDDDEALADNPLLAYGATLLAAVLIGERVTLLQLGDGDILAVSEQGEVHRPIASDPRLIANETTSLCLPDAVADFRTRVLGRDEPLPALLLLATDGYSNAFATEDDFLRVGSDVLMLVRSEGALKLQEDLAAWLTEASEEGSGDDVTAAFLVRSEERAPDPDDLLADTVRLHDEASPDATSGQGLATPTRSANKERRSGRTVAMMMVIAVLALVAGVVLGRGLLAPSPAHEDGDVESEPAEADAGASTGNTARSDSRR